MSKRARITLESETETAAGQETGAEPFPENEPHTDDSHTAASDTPPRSPLPAGMALNRGTIVKAVFAGLAVVSLVLLWKNRRP